MELESRIGVGAAVWRWAGSGRLVVESAARSRASRGASRNGYKGTHSLTPLVHHFGIHAQYYVEETLLEVDCTPYRFQFSKVGTWTSPPSSESIKLVEYLNTKPIPRELISKVNTCRLGFAQVQ